VSASSASSSALCGVVGAPPPRPRISGDLPVIEVQAGPPDQQPGGGRPPVRAVFGDGDLGAGHVDRGGPAVRVRRRSATTAQSATARLAAYFGPLIVPDLLLWSVGLAGSAFPTQRIIDGAGSSPGFVAGKDVVLVGARLRILNGVAAHGQGPSDRNPEGIPGTGVDVAEVPVPAQAPPHAMASKEISIRNEVSNANVNDQRQDEEEAPLH